ncbi:MAG TPA: hypothetical protein VML19_30615 [Verrucomicrobiae bacterium]|nr:hypothetical protein [Verrucomicrobiae bacterium]
MFEELQDRMKRDDDATTTPGQRWLKNAVVIILAALIFGGLYAALRFMES